MALAQPQSLILPQKADDLPLQIQSCILSLDHQAADRAVIPTRGLSNIHEFRDKYSDIHGESIPVHGREEILART